MTAILRVGAALAALLAAGACLAQQAVNYPTRQVRVIVPYPPGGPTDVIARLLAQKLTDTLGHSFYVENLTGASGAVGAGAAASSPADGHTLLVVTNDFAVAPVTSSKLPYDPVKNFTPVSIVSASPQVVIAHPSFPARSLAELAELARKQPGSLSYASMSIGFGQLTAERFFRLALKADMVRVPFQGAAPLINSTTGGHTPVAYIGLPPAMPLIKDGKLRALAVSSAVRLPTIADVPPFREVSGDPEFEAVSWHALFARAGTPEPIVTKLHDEMTRIMSDPEIQEKITTLGLIPLNPPSIADTQAYIASETKKWGGVVKSLGLEATQ